MIPTSFIDYKQHLSLARRLHSEAVALTAERYVMHHRLALDRDEVRLACLYHDLCREWKLDALLQYTEQKNLMVSEEERRTPVLLHGPVAAHLLKKAGFSPSVTTAIRHHSLGSPEMGLLGLVLYIADALGEKCPYRSEGTRNRLLLSPPAAATLALIAEEREYRVTLSEATEALAAHLMAERSL